MHKNDYHADLSSNLTKYPGLKLVNIGRVNAKICPILFCINIVFSVSIRSVPAGKVVSRSSMVPAIIYDNFLNFLSNVKFVNSTVQCWTVGAIFTFGHSRMFGPDNLRPLVVGCSRSRRIKKNRETYVIKVLISNHSQLYR